MTASREATIGRIERRSVTVTRPARRGLPRRIALGATIAVAALGAASFGVFTLAQGIGGHSEGNTALVRGAEASAARLSAQADFYAANGRAPAQIDRNAQLDAYGARWAALAGREPVSQDALDAYAARWSALDTSRPPVSPEALDAYGARWAALATVEPQG